MMLQCERAQLGELAGKFADFALQILVRSADAVPRQFHGMDMFSLPRAAIGSRHLIPLSDSLHLAFGVRGPG